MSQITVIEDVKGYQLCRQDETDEYLRVFRSVYIITAPNGQKVGNVYKSCDDAKKVFEQIIKDL